MIGKLSNNFHHSGGVIRTRILVVDDDPDIVASLKDLLELEIDNCCVDFANCVQQAVLIAQ